MFKITKADELITKELIEDLSYTYGTPLYLYFEKIIRERTESVKNVFSEVNIFPTFACKANNNPRLLNIISSEGFGMDVVTLGEYHASKLAGVPDEKIVWNGNGKSLEDMSLLAKVGYINIDSVEEFERWKESSIQSNASFFLRINPNVDPKTHPHISTGLKKNKFGIPIEYVKKVLKDSKYRNMISGFHVHIGSQITDVEPFREAIYQVVKLSHRYDFSKINIGGGWGINYCGTELDLEEYRKVVTPLLKDFEEVVLELGRYIIAPASVLILKVEYVKKTQDKVFVVVDGGMNMLIRPVLYNAHHNLIVLEPTTEKVVADIVGPLCESGDVIATDREIWLPRVGSYILVENVGAYGYSMTSNYNTTSRPAEVLITAKNEERLIRRRETFDDLFRLIV